MGLARAPIERNPWIEVHLSFRQIARAAAVAVAASLVALPACYVSDTSRCDYVERRCRTVCDYWCDGWGCYPSCYDQCWDVCYVDDRPPPAPPAPDPPPAPPRPAPTDDAGTPPPVVEAGAPSGPGAPCAACTTNADCASGALCVVRGGSREGFCGGACSGPESCPSGFTCASIGSSKQCLPTSGRCD